MVQGTYCTKGKDTITDEGLLLLDDMEMWLEKQNLMWVCHQIGVVGGIRGADTASKNRL